MPSIRARPAAAVIFAAIFAATGLLLATAAAAEAHVHEAVGSYELEIGWLVEPAYVGQPNAVQVTITDSAGHPVVDLGADDLKVVVSTGGQDSPSLSFEPGFDPGEGTGPQGEYDARILPTAPGDYAFHITGSIHGTKVDLTEASSDTTFDPVVGSDDIEFPAKVPTLTEVATRLDRIDARIATIQQDSGSVAAQNAAIADASANADRALLVGGGIGLLGLIVAVVALLMGRRRRTP
jgi:hypothetical protein